MLCNGVRAMVMGSRWGGGLNSSNRVVGLYRVANYKD